MLTEDNKTLKGAVPTASRPEEIASGVYCLEVGKGIMRSNVYFVRSGTSLVLIDTGSARCDREIQGAAESLFGTDTPPSAILLTHDHPDHAGSTPALARRWGCAVYVHPDELALVRADFSTFFSIVKRYANPLDTWVILPLLRLMPRRRVSRQQHAPLIRVRASHSFQTGSAFPHRVTHRATCPSSAPATAS